MPSSSPWAPTSRSSANSTRSSWGRAQVVVKDRATALREAGDVIQPVREGVLAEDDLVDLCDLVTGGVQVDTSRPRVFKCVGMSWEDLAVAVGVVDPTVVPD